MRIISNFKDYYDGLAQFGKDEKPIYNRIKEDIHLGTKFHNGQTTELVAMRRAMQPMIDLIGTMPYGMPNFYNVALLGFCGKIYPVYNNKIANLDSIVAEVRGTKFSEGIRKFYGWNKKALEKFENGRRKASGRQVDRSFIKDNLEHFFANFKTEIGDTIFVQLGVPTFLLSSKHYQWTYNFNEDAYLVKNPCLREYEFHKILDAYHCYQELDQYLGNNMAEIGHVEPRGITDKLKAEAHGFNDLSFRKTKDEDSKARKRKAKEEAKRIEQEQKLKSRSDWEKDFE